jgi:hypothetical protein
MVFTNFLLYACLNFCTYFHGCLQLSAAYVHNMGLFTVEQGLAKSSRGSNLAGHHFQTGRSQYNSTARTYCKVYTRYWLTTSKQTTQHSLPGNILLTIMYTQPLLGNAFANKHVSTEMTGVQRWMVFPTRTERNVITETSIKVSHLQLKVEGS